MRYKLIVGLGNPGKEYVNTYHNAGFIALNFLTGDGRYKKHGLFEYVKSGVVVFVKPLTYMNESGAAVSQALRFFKKEAGDLLIIHDDTDIPLGERRLSCNRGSAGHNGVKSIIESLGTKEFCRLRIGIRLPEHNGKAGEVVLRKIRRSERVVIEKAIKNSADELGIIPSSAS